MTFAVAPRGRCAMLWRSAWTPRAGHGIQPVERPARRDMRFGMTLRWGIIGCGDVCEVKSGPALYKARGSALTWVMRRDGERARDFARRHGVARSTTDAAELIAAPDVDIVYIATPPGDHEAYALRVAAANK